VSNPRTPAWTKAVQAGKQQLRRTPDRNGWQNTVALMNSATNKPNASLWLRLLIAFGCYLIVATAIFALLNRFGSPTAMPKLLAVTITNGTIFGLPYQPTLTFIRRILASMSR
jgi:hypothetical protein